MLVQACVPGKYRAFKGATDITECLVCPAGKWSGSTQSTECTNCPAGTWSSATGADVITTCKLYLDSECLQEEVMMFVSCFLSSIYKYLGETKGNVSFSLDFCLPEQTHQYMLGTCVLSTDICRITGASVTPSTTHPGLGTLSSLGNYAPAGSTTMDNCINTMSMCPNVPFGAEMLLDQYLNCGASCVRSCTANTEMLTGTCADTTGTGTVCKACTGSFRMDMTVTTTL